MRGIRPGLDKLTTLRAFPDVPDTIKVTSPAFSDGGSIPVAHSADGAGLSPPLAWTGVPNGTAAVVLVIEDADSPTPDPLVHAMVFDLPGQDGALGAGVLKGPAGPGVACRLGKNSFLKAEYLPPDPPTGHGPHRYCFQIFALDAPLKLDGEPGRSALIDAMANRVLAKGSLIGTYERA